MPANPAQRFDLPQPDGSTVRARPFGDEFTNGLETLDGYTLIEHGEWWEYARKTASGDLEPTGLRAGVDDPSGLPRGLRDTSEPPPYSPFGARGALGGPLESDDLISGRAVPAIGIQRSLVILVQFADEPSVTTPANWSSRFFGATASVDDYYREVSYGKLDFQAAAESSGTVNDGIVGWLTLPTDQPHMTNFDDTAGSARARTAVIDAIKASNPFVNYAAYDTSGNGQLSPDELHITVIMAGLETATCRPLGSVWGYKSGLGPDSPVVDGVYAGVTYTTFGERQCNGQLRHQATLGIIAHELGHDLGWPDLYDTDHSTDLSSAGGVGSWSLMSYGTWTRTADHQPGEDPAHPDAFLKYYQGWLRRPRSSGPSPAVRSPRPRPNRPRFGCSTTRAASTGRSAAPRGPGCTSWSRTASGSATTARCPPAAC